MKRGIFIIIVVFFVFIIQNLSHSIYSLWQKRELLIRARNDVAKAKQENRSLKDQMAAVKEPSFIEEQARDKLLLAKPGEQIFVVSDKLIVKDTAIKAANSQKSNWQLWWELFFP